MSDCAGAWYAVVLTVEERREYRIWATGAEEAQAKAMQQSVTKVAVWPYTRSRGFPIVESVTELTPKEAT